MARGGGTFVVLGTTVVAVLAVGAAVGADALAGTPDPVPSSTIAMSDDFCTLMDEMVTYVGAKEGALVDSTLKVMFGSVDEAVELDDIHAWGELSLEYWGDIQAYERHAAEVVSDPAVTEAFESSMAGINVDGVRSAQVAIGAIQSSDFVDALNGKDRSEGDQAIVSEAEAANEAISTYVLTECGIDLGGGADGGGTEAPPAATTAKTDASTLGKEIATAFVDWVEGDPLPTVSLSDGMYGLTVSSTSDGGTSISTSSFGAASSDPAIVDQAITGRTDWCVAVTDNAAASPTTYRYSATGGLEEGTCAALAGG